MRGPLRYNRGPLAIRELIGRAVRRQKRQFGAWRLKLAFQPCATGPGINTEGNPQTHKRERSTIVRLLVEKDPQPRWPADLQC